jgi:hypothetical protein
VFKPWQLTKAGHRWFMHHGAPVRIREECEVDRRLSLFAFVIAKSKGNHGICFSFGTTANAPTSATAPVANAVLETYSTRAVGLQRLMFLRDPAVKGTGDTAMNEPQTRPRSIWGTLLKWTAIVLLLAVTAVILVGLFVLDGRYDLSREISIKAPPEAVHKQVGDLREWPNWLPFIKEDPSLKTTIEQPTGVGAHQHWTGKGGTGDLTFTASDENKGIEYDMTFDGKWKSKGTLTYVRSGDETRVTWRMFGQNDDFLGKWMGALMNTLVGPKFEDGLADLKKKVEADQGR